MILLETIVLPFSGKKRGYDLILIKRYMELYLIIFQGNGISGNVSISLRALILIRMSKLISLIWEGSVDLFPTHVGVCLGYLL